MAEAPPSYNQSTDQEKVTMQGFSNYPGIHYQATQPVMSQPVGQQGQQGSTTVIINQPMQMQSNRMWSSGICGCFDEMSSCCLGWFCPCILACRVATDLGESCCVPCCVNGGLVALRTKLRTQQHIQGNIMNDGCTICCCYVCTLCQMSRELTYIRNTQPQTTFINQ